MRGVLKGVASLGISYAPVDTTIKIYGTWYVRLFMAYVGEVGALITDKDSKNYTKCFIPGLL